METASAVAVVISLIFVGLEVRESARQTELNTQSLQVSAYQDLIAQINAMNILLFEFPVAGTLFGASSSEDLSSEEYGQLTALYLLVTRHGDLAYYQYELGMLTEARLESALGALNDWVCTPLFSEFWSNFRQNFTASYRDFVDSKISARENC